MVRFGLLRDSINQFASGITHYILVDSEDQPLFQERFGKEKGLEIIPSSELLPSKIESQRRNLRTWRNWLHKRIAWRMGLDPEIMRGWKVQQLLKLHFLPQAPVPNVAFVDSDVLFVGDVNPSYFFDGDRLAMLETPAANAEDYAFEVATNILLKNPLQSVRAFYNYIHQAPRFTRATGQVLLAELERKWDDWPRRFLREVFPSEYCLLGYAARELQHYEGYSRVQLPQEQWAYRIQFKGDEIILNEMIDTCIKENGFRKFMLIQSNLRIPEEAYVPVVRHMLEVLRKNGKARES